MFPSQRPVFVAALLATLACAESPEDDAVDTEVIDETDPVDTEVDGETDTEETDVTACNVTPPATWSAPNWAANTVDALALRAALDTLNNTMRQAEQGTATIDELSDLTSLYDAGTPSLSSATTAAFDPVVDEVFAEFLQVLAAGTQDLTDDDGDRVAVTCTLEDSQEKRFGAADQELVDGIQLPARGESAGKPAGDRETSPDRQARLPQESRTP